MKKIGYLAMLLCSAWVSQAAAQSSPAAAEADMKRITLVVHGGAGNLTPATIPPELAAQHRTALEAALKAGHAILAKGGSSVDAVIATIKVFEDDPLFNAGKGAVFTHAGKNELDASLMDGRTGQAGAVAGVTTVKNPITAARAVMDKTKHVLLASQGAEAFAAAQNLEIVPPEYFFTQRRWDQLQSAKEEGKIKLDHDGKAKTSALPSDPFALWQVDHKFGTVGAVALDAYGNLAAGTSTGGLTNKLYGRVGDSPIIGAGTYADNRTVAVSATGTGEFFMRGLVAYDISARMKYAGSKLSDAVDQAIHESVTQKNGRGGVIALDRKGEIKFSFNTEGMHRGYIKADGQAVVKSFAN